MNLLVKILTALALASALCGCSNWQRIETREQWTLYAKKGESLDAERFERALAPAFVAVEKKLGPFEDRVRVHAWNDPDQFSDMPRPMPPGVAPIEDVPGIGKARVRAYHVTGGATLFAPTGVFLGTAEVGTVVHELVHARLAEMPMRVPLWFEEGLASLWGDGVFHEGRWVFDGFACWPARVLREEQISDEELARVLQLSASQDYSSRDNLLVHFVGWALVFDLARELPNAGWRGWLEHFEADAKSRTQLLAARDRIARSTQAATIRNWLVRLNDPDPGVRLATAKGIWKLRSQAAIDALLAALPKETDVQVRLSLSLNVLLAQGEMRLSRRTSRDLWRNVLPGLGELNIEDDAERVALRQFLGGMRGRGGSTQKGLDGLARYWEE
jgi:hypothetical protein